MCRVKKGPAKIREWSTGAVVKSEMRARARFAGAGLPRSSRLALFMTASQYGQTGGTRELECATRASESVCLSVSSQVAL